MLVRNEDRTLRAFVLALEMVIAPGLSTLVIVVTTFWLLSNNIWKK